MHRPIRIEQSPLERARLWVEILAFVAAGVWAIYTFLYQTRIAPMLLPPHEIISLDVQRIATLPSDYIERVTVTFHNDSSVDADTAALSENVYAATTSTFAHLNSSVTPTMVNVRTVPAAAWNVVQSQGLLFDGSILGKGRSNDILRPGDSNALQFIAVVPRGYSTLRVRVQTIFGRYPIEPRFDVRLTKIRGAVSLQSDYISQELNSYFSV